MTGTTFENCCVCGIFVTDWLLDIAEFNNKLPVLTYYNIIKT